MIRIETFGTPACYRDDVALPELPAQKTRFALLVYLAIERNVSRDEAAALFWAESGEERARHTLSQMLYELKRLLGDSWLETQSGRLAVTEELVADAGAMSTLCAQRRFTEAADIYRGPFLNGFFLANCKGFETWVDRQRLQYERLHRKACREAVNDLIEKKNVQGAIEAARKWVALDPLEDEANHRLIDLLAASGKRSEALREYDVYERRIREELQVEPLEETRQLVARLRAEKSASGSAGAGVLGPALVERLPLSVSVPSRSRRWLYGSVATLVTLAVGGAWLARNSEIIGRSSSIEQLDTTRIALLPFHYEPNVKVRLNEEYLLQDAIERWQGISAADLLQVRDALAAESTSLTPDRALKVARTVKAGLYIQGEVAILGDSLRIHASLYDARHYGTPIVDRTEKLPSNLVGANVAFMRLLDALLFEESNPVRDDEPPGTHIWAAQRAFLQGRRAMRDWHLGTADSAFSKAVKLDPDFARASLWRAQIGAWSAPDATRWRFAAERALTDSSHLTLWEQRLAHALVQFSDGHLERACPELRDLATTRTHDFGAWFSLATCLRVDLAVVDDRNSASGKSFRASYHEAVNAYRNAFRLNPRALRSFSAGAYLPARNLFYAVSDVLRGGVGVGGDTTKYMAYPTRRGDTLAFVPFPRSQTRRAPPGTWQEVEAGLLLEKQLFRSIAADWRSTEPDDPDAAELMGIALEMLGDERAIDTLEVARKLAPTAERRLHIAAYEVSVLLKFAFPDDPRRLKQLISLSDSVLRQAATTRVADRSDLAGVAMVRGRVDLAARYAAADISTRMTGLPSTISDLVTRLLVYSAAGGPRDSVLWLQRRTLAFMRATNKATQDELRSWLFRSVMLSFPQSDASATASLQSVDDLVLAAQRAEAARSPRLARDYILRDMAVRSAVVPPEDLTFDVLFPESALLSRVGDLRGASNWLDPALRTIVQRGPRTFCDPVNVAALLRAAALRAQIATRTGDRATAARWRIPLTQLLKGADPVFRDGLSKM